MKDKLSQHYTKLAALIKQVESSPTSGRHDAVLSEATSLLDEAEAFNHGMSSLSASADATVEDRLVFALKSVTKDWVVKADAAVKRELDKLTNVVVDEVRPVLSSAGVDKAKEDVNAAAKDLEHAGDLEAMVEVNVVNVCYIWTALY